MPRAAAAVATAVFAASVVVGSPQAWAAPVEDPVPDAACGTLGSAVCDLVDLLRDAGVGLDPLEGALAELDQLVAPAPSPAPADAPAGSSPGGTASSSSASGPTGFGGNLSAAEGSSRGGASGPSIPSVQVGGPLELGPLALPSFTPRSAPSAHELAREVAVAKLVGPAVAAGLAPEDPDSSRATAVVLALCMLMLAAGLLLDQRHKARLPIRL
jgi:hypothetical protein